MSTTTTIAQRLQVGGPWLLLVVLAEGISLAAILWPWAAGGVIVLLLFTAMAMRALSGLRFWQQITLIALMGYAVLGYGFTNLTLPRVPVPVGHLLMSAGLLLALPGRGADIRTFIREPLVWCWLALSSLTMLHLIVEIPRYGIWALRDSNFVVEGIFLLSGYLWARSRLGAHSMARNLWLVFLVNFLYSLTMQESRTGCMDNCVSETLMAISPRSGVFLDVPLLGTYWHSSLWLLYGALFAFLIGGRALKWPTVIVSGVALLQLFWSLVFEARTTYVGIVAAIAILAFTGERGRAAKAIGGIAISIVLIVVLGALGVQLGSRFGSLSPEFLIEHVRSIFLAPGTPGVGTTQWRVDTGSLIMERWTASPATIAIGEGFGQALTELEISPVVGEQGTGVQVRSPHNTQLTVLTRLGLVGLLFWALMHARITYLLVRAVRAASQATLAHGFGVWMIGFYVLGMLYTSVQPWLEFPQGAIPFYTLIGFGIGLAHPHGSMTAASTASRTRHRPNGE